jgi:hypothetical protein
MPLGQVTGTTTKIATLLSLGQPTLMAGGGVLDKEHVRRYIKRNLLKLQSCYDQLHADKPTLAGTVTAKLTIEIRRRLPGHVPADRLLWPPTCAD